MSKRAASKKNISIPVKTGDRKKSRPLRTIITIPVISFISGSILIVAAFGAFMSYRSTVDCLENAISSEASVAAKTVDYKLERCSTLIEEIAVERRVYQDELTNKEKVAFINEKAEYYNLTEAHILTTSGKDIGTGVSYADTDYFQASKNGQSYVTSPYTDSSGKLVITVATPIWTDAKEGSTVKGVLCFSMLQSEINSVVDGIQISKNGSAYIIDKDGYTIAHVNIDNVINKDNILEDVKTDAGLQQLAELDKAAIAGETGFGQYTYNGVKKFIAYAPIANSDGWSICINAPISDFTGKVMTTIYIMIILAILFIAGGVVGCIYIAKRVSEPIKVYVDRLTLLAKGDVKTPLPDIGTESAEFVVLKDSLESTLDNTSAVIDDIDHLLTEFSAGNFDIFSSVTDKYVGDYKHILTSFRTLKHGLTESFQNILQVSEQVSAGSSQVSFGAQSLAQGATEQASSVEELSASIQDIAQRVKANAEDAEKAKALTSETENIMQGSVGDMNLASQAMDEISETSKNISKVIKTIDDIAFQTNILALNAAVEAARAGAAGKGFAVVADEVRNLSQKSAEAAKNTTVLIESSINAVEKGTSLVNKTSVGFAQVAEKASEIVVLVDDISTQAQEQSAAISQISIGIDQVSSVVQMNSATSEESAAASEELSSQAEVLKGLVDQFKLATSYHEET